MLTVRIDWNNDTTYSHPQADISAQVLRAEWALGYPQPVRAADSLPPDASAVLELDNSDGRFSPANTNSPLAGLLVPGRRVQLLLDAVPLWTGWLQRLSVAPGEHGPRTATLSAAGGLFLLAQHRPAFPPQLSQRAHSLIRDLLAQLPASPALQNGWLLQRGTLGSDTQLYAVSDQLLDTAGQTVFPYVGDVWGDTTSALRVIETLVQAERGWFWQGRDGRFVFRDRHHYLTATATPPSINADDVASAATYAHGDDLATVVRVTCYPRAVSAANSVLWQSRAPLRIGPLQQKTFLVHIDGVVSGVLSLETPRPYTDFTATDDRGRDYTGSLALSALLDSGSLARITVSNPLPVALSVTLQLRGIGVTLYDAVTVEATGVDALLEHGRRLLSLRIPLLDDPETARNLAAWLLQQRQTPHGQLQHLTLHATDHPADAPTRTTLQSWTLGTRLDVQESHSNDAQRYLVTGETGRYAPAEGLQLNYTLTRLDSTPYTILDQQGPLGVGVVGY